MQENNTKELPVTPLELRTAPAQKSRLEEENTRSDELQLVLSGEKSVGSKVTLLLL
jgi:hypothetical protein